MKAQHRHANSVHAGTAAAGFTLIEVMIVVAVIGILAAIAYPSYQAHVVKTRRSTASACLMEVAQYMERYYTSNMKYSGATLPDGQNCRAELSPYYTFALTTNASTPRVYSVSAEPKGAQKDEKCGKLELTHTGEKKEGGTGTVDDCW